MLKTVLFATMIELEDVWFWFFSFIGIVILVRVIWYVGGKFGPSHPQFKAQATDQPPPPGQPEDITTESFKLWKYVGEHYQSSLGRMEPMTFDRTDTPWCRNYNIEFMRQRLRDIPGEMRQIKIDVPGLGDEEIKAMIQRALTVYCAKAQAAGYDL